MRERVGLDRTHVLALLTAFVTDGHLRRIGSRRGTRYVRPDAR